MRLREQALTEKRQISYNIVYMHNLKKSDTNELIQKMKLDSQTQKMNLQLTVGRRMGQGIDWEFGIDMYRLLYIKQITNKGYYK